jgi:hypothetical protein
VRTEKFSISATWRVVKYLSMCSTTPLVRETHIFVKNDKGERDSNIIEATNFCSVADTISVDFSGRTQRAISKNVVVSLARASYGWWAASAGADLPPFTLLVASPGRPA